MNQISDITMRGVVNLYNPFAYNRQTIERKDPDYRFPGDYTIVLNNVHFINHLNDVIDLNVTMHDDEDNFIEFKEDDDGIPIIQCYGVFNVNVPFKYIQDFNMINNNHASGFIYDISVVNSYTKKELTNDCIEIQYPEKLYFNNVIVVPDQ